MTDTDILPRLDNAVADVRLVCLQLAMKLAPDVGLDAEDIVKAAATFSRFVIDGVQACPLPASGQADDRDSLPLLLATIAEQIGSMPFALDEILRILGGQAAIVRAQLAETQARAKVGVHMEPAR